MTFHWRPSRRRAGTGRPLFDDAVVRLEDRIMLDAVPVVSVTPPEHVLLNTPDNSFQVTLTFANTGSQPGFGPYVEVVVPKNGADGVAFGAANADGATFVGATYLGQPVAVAANLTFDAAGHATDPLSGDVVSGTPGDGLVVLRLPFGSFTPPQTPAALVATFAQSPFGNVGVPLAITARGGFQYGLDPLDDPATDPHLVGAAATATYTPTLAVLTKTSDAPTNTQEETATGPNNDHTYTLSLDVADGQTLTGAMLTDALPDSIVYLGATVAAGTGTIVSQPAIGAVVDPAHNLLAVDFGSLTGGPGTSDAVVTVHFYVNATHFDGTPVVDPTTGAPTTTVNDAHLTSTFTPLDPIDPVIAFTLDATHADTIHDKAVAVQKSAAIVTDTGPAGLNSGDTIEYRVTLEVSDYVTLGTVSLTDVLGDGQRLDTSFLPTIAVTERGVTSATAPIAGVTVGPVAAGDVTTGHEFAGTFASSFDRVSGTTTSTVDVSGALVLAGIDPAGLLAGGRTRPGDAAAATGGTTVTVTFRAVVQNNFESDQLAPANRAVHQGDTVGNGVTVAAAIRDNAAPATVLDPAATRDDGAASLTLPRGGVTKTIYAIDGDTNLKDFAVGGNVQLVAGDSVTYRLTYSLPVTSYAALSLTDFLPLPVLAAGPLTFSPSTPFAAGTYAYGPTDTLHLQPNAPAPTETFDPAGNSVRFAYADYSIQNQVSPSAASKVDLLFTVPVLDSTFADGLFLTNLATSSESNTPGNATAGNSIVRFALGQPRLLVQKAIVSASAGTITTPETVPGLTFLAPGTTAAGRGYTLAPGAALTDITVAGTKTAAAAHLNSNVTGLDGGDTARVALVVNNQGSSLNGAFDAVLNDTLAPGTSFLGGSLATANLIVTRGDGTIFTAGTDYSVTQTATGLSLHFLDGATARIEKTGAADHGDIVLVTYDIHVDDGVTISPVALTSSATITAFAAVPGGINQVTVPPTDAATIGLLQPAVVKTLVATSDPSTTGSNLTIGELATYEVTYTLPEGTTPLVRLLDTLPVSPTAGAYDIVSASIVSVGANLRQADGVTALDAATFGPAAVAHRATTTTATFGGTGVTVVDLADNAVTPADTIVVDYVVRATTAATNVTGLSGVNTGQLTYGPTNTRTTATAPIGITLPDLTVTKAFVPNGDPTPDANDPVTFTITVANLGTVTGYALSLSDPLPGGLGAISVVGVSGAGLTPADFAVAGNALTLVNPIDLAGGQSFTVTLMGTVSGTIHPGSTLTNTATLGYDSATGVPQATIRTTTTTGSTQVSIAPDTIAKSILTTSVGNDASATVDVGELVTFNLVTTLAEGSSDALTVSDALPAGLTFVSGQLVAVGAKIGGATLAPVLTTPGGVPTFAFGNVTDLADNLPQDDADRIVVRITARVADVPANVAGTVLTDVATAATFVDGRTLPETSALAVTVAVPDVVIAKALATPGTPDAGDTVDFTINVHHAADSTATAFGLGLLDALPAGLTNLRVVAVDDDPAGTGANGLALTPASFTTAGNHLALAAPLDLATNQAFTVTIAADVADATVVGSTVTNAASLTYGTLPGGDGRVATHGASAAVTTAASQSLTKVITATDDPLTGTAAFRAGITDLAIGESATVALTATFEQGTTPGVVIVDHLPVSGGPAATSGTLGFAAPPVLTPGPGITFTGSGTGVLSDTNGDGIADTVTYTLGSVTVPGTPGAGTGAVTVTYQATALDRPENAAGDALTSPATLTSALGVRAASVGYDLVAPNLVMTKTVQVNAGGADAGDPVIYTIHLVNTGTGPAADIVLTDVLPPGLSDFAGGAVSVDGGPYSFQPIPTLAPGHTADEFYAVVIKDSAVAGATLTNVATATYDSHAGPGGRPGTASASASFTTLASQALTKTITQTEDPLTGTAQYRPGVTDLAIGEYAGVSLVATLQQGTTNNVVLTDHLPTNVGPAATGGTLGFYSTPYLSLPPGTTITGSTAPVLTDTDGDGIADTVTYNLGNVTITGSGAGASGPGTASIGVFYFTKALDRPENAAGDALASPATLTSALGTVGASVDYDLVAPNVVVTKVVTTSGTPQAGDTVGYRVTLTNTGSGPAEGLVFRDPGAAGIALGDAVVTAGSATFTAYLPGFGLSLPVLLPGQTDTIAYTGTVTDAAVTGAPEVNTATASYTSAVATGGGHAASASASATVTTAATQAFTKAIVATSVASTGDAAVRPGVTDLVIGETATVELTATLSAGTTNDVVITDHLPAAATGDVSTGGTLTFSGQPTVTIGGATVALAASQIVRSDTNGDGIVDTISFNLGTVVIPGDATPANDAVRIRYDVVAADLAVNASGDRLHSPATLTSALGTLGAAVDVDLVQPALTIDTVASVAVAKPGDIVTYTVTVANPAGGTAQAEDVTIRDLLDGATPLTLIPGTVTTSQGSVALGNAAGDTSVSIGAGSIAVGGPPVVVTFAARVGAAAPGSTLDTTADALFDGIPGAVVNGQAGRRDSVADDAPVGIVGLTKAIVATSLPETGSARFRPAAADLAIGETATFALTVTLPAGATPVSLTDLLGDGHGVLALVGTPTVATSAGVVAGPLTVTHPDVNGDGTPDLGFALGTVTGPAGGGTVTITYTARVADVAANVAGGALDLPATLDYGPGTLTAVTGVDLVAPAVTLAKAVATPVAGPDAGDTVTYTVTATNTGSGPAYDVTLGDALPAGLTAVAGSGRLTVGGTTTGVAATSVVLPLLDAGATAVVTFDAVIGDGAATGAALTNTATAAFDSAPGGGRTGAATASATFATLGGEALTKVITATGDPLTGTAAFRAGVTDLAIGETATVNLVATLEQGTTAGVVLVDHLPVVGAGGTLGFVGTPVVALPAGATFTGSATGVLSDTNGDGIADTVTFTLGTVTIPGTPGPGTGTIVVTYTAQALDRPENVAGAALASPASLTSALGSVAASVDYDLVAPNLVVTKAVTVAAGTPGGTPDAGDAVTYTVTLTNTGSGPAEGIVLTDVAAPGVTVAGTAQVTPGSMGGGPTTVSLAGGAPLPDLLPGASATVTYTAVVADAAATGASATNTATVTSTSGAAGGHAATASASATFTTAAVQSLAKTVVATSEAFTGTAAFRPTVPDLTIGEAATIELRATLSEGTTANVVLTDTLQVPGGTLVLNGTPLIVFGDGTTAPFTGTVTTVDTNGDGVPDTVRFALGTVTIPGGNDPARDTIAIRYQAVVADRPENVAGDLLTLPATLASSLGTTTASAGIDLVAPVLSVTKVVDPVQPGDGTTAFTVTVGHAAGSSAAATGVVLTDLVPAGTLFAGATVVGGPAGASVAGDAVSVPLLGLGDSLVVRVTTRLDPAHPVTTPTLNHATVTYGSTTGGGGRAGAAAATAPEPPYVPPPPPPPPPPPHTIVSTVRFRDAAPLGPVAAPADTVPPLLIEPVYSGAAEPGSYVELTVTDEHGSISSEGGGLTDAGGDWLVRLPSTSVETLLRHASLDDYYASTRLFRPPFRDLFADHDLFGAVPAGSRIDIGSTPAFGTQVVHLTVTDSTAGVAPGYAPTWRDQFFVETPGLNVERAFADAAGRSLARLYEADRSPEAAGLNRFNRAFLLAADL